MGEDAAVGVSSISRQLSICLAATEEKGLAELNRKYELGQIPFGGCTCVMTTNSKGEVISGRNMDIEVSQYPAYLFRVSFGKYIILKR